MKRSLITALVFLVIGFGAGWFFRSASQDLTSIEQTVPNLIKKPDQSLGQVQDGNDTPASFTDDRRSRPPRVERVPGADGSELPRSTDALDNAKWLRLGEVLGLQGDQAKAIQALIAETQPNASATANPDAAFAEAGAKLEEQILSALNSEQREEFKNLQERDRENRIESKARQSFEAQLSGLDLSAEQREKAMETLREDAGEKVSEIADSTRLLLAGSVLPIGSERLTEDGLRLFAKLKSSPDAPPFDISSLAKIHRDEIESKLDRFQNILTPGQLARYRLALEESLSNLEKMSPQN